MKAIVGVDLAGRYEAALHLIARLEFADLGAELLHVSEPMIVYPAEAFAYSSEVIEVEVKTDSDLLDTAGKVCEELAITVQTKETIIGSPAGWLMDRADETHSDLICVGSTNKGRYGCFFFGSVGRALAIGSKHSVLVAKGMVPCSGKVNAVLATDHSMYADDAIQLLVRMRPKGLGTVRIVTALDREMLKGAPEAEERLETYMEAKSAEAVESLRDAGIAAVYEVVRGNFPAVIDRQMRLSNSEILIMGAQGHGFMDRLFIGSSSLQQVVGTPHSVLILRP